MKTIVVPVPNETKRKLDEMRKRGYTINGFVRQALAAALADVKVPRRRAAMKIFAVLVFMLTAAPAFAVPLTVEFEGSTVNGTVTYDSTQTPSAYNVRGLAPNVVYTLSAWDMTFAHDFVSPSLTDIEVVRFSNDLAGNTSEFCVGTCIFSSQPYERLFFSNGSQTLQLTFSIPSLTPFLTNPPDTLEEWGPLFGVNEVNGGASWLKAFNADGSFRVGGLLSDGGIVGVTSTQAAPVAAVPEPSTWIFLVSGLVGLAIGARVGRALWGKG